VVATLVASHTDYVWEEWMLPGPDRAARLEPLVRLDVELVALPTGEVWIHDHDASVAIWQQPDAPALGPETVARLDAAAVTAFGARLGQLQEVEDLVHLLRPAEPHWYLGTIGTLAHRRRQGCATAVLRPVLEHLDRIGAPAYLETSASENISFYTRLGFEVVAGLEGLPHGAPDTWGMQRNPGAETVSDRRTG